MKKIIAILLAGLMLTSLLTGCGGTVDLEASKTTATPTAAATDAPVITEGETEQATAAPTEPSEEASMKVGVLFTTAGLGDNNFNDMVKAGLDNAKSSLGITYDYAEPTSDGELMSMLHGFAQDGSYDLIITLSPESATALEEVAEQYPDQKFTLIDAAVDLPNIRSLVKIGPEQCFLTGVLAGLITVDDSMEFANDKKVVGSLVGADFPIPRAMSVGFAAGARFYDSEIEVIELIVGDFGDVNKMKELSLNMYDKGVDIVQNLAGSGLGLFTAAEEKGFYAIGAGANQNPNYPDYTVATAGFILTSLVEDDCASWLAGTWEPGLVNPGLRDGVFDYITDGSNVVLSESILAKVEAARNWYLENEDVKLPSQISEIDAWIEQYSGSVEMD